VTLRRSGDHLYIKVNSSGEELKVQDHFYSTTWGIEQLIFADATTWDRTQILGAAWIVGTSSGETINGTSDPDTIDGLGGNDTLKGAANGDTYIYASGSGNDTIIENSDGAAIDKVKLVGLNPSDVTFSRTGDHLTITITTTGEQLKIQDHFYSTTWGVEQLIFADNTTWDRATIVAQVPTTGMSGNDTINGTSSDNALRGGLGNDTLLGGAGHDVYLYASGDGNDIIDDESGSTSEVDTLWFSNINAGDITLTRSGYDVKINVTATGEQISVLWPYWNASQNWGIDQVRFADGTTWNRDTIMQKVWWNGTAGNDTMSGWGSYDQIDGGSGNDTISGNAGVAADGVDIIVGGAGNDALSGGSGNDTFLFRSGFGLDTIADFTAGSGSGDVIELRDNIFADYSAVIAAASTSGSDTVITVDASNRITLTGVALASLHQDDFLFV
jgi:Ca2+-binding RTX toxin-like protein